MDDDEIINMINSIVSDRTRQAAYDRAVKEAYNLRRYLIDHKAGGDAYDHMLLVIRENTPTKRYLVRQLARAVITATVMRTDIDYDSVNTG